MLTGCVSNGVRTHSCAYHAQLAVAQVHGLYSSAAEHHLVALCMLLRSAQGLLCPCILQGRIQGLADAPQYSLGHDMECHNSNLQVQGAVYTVVQPHLST
jgi:hypothetical protein